MKTEVRPSFLQPLTVSESSNGFEWIFTLIHSNRRALSLLTYRKPTTGLENNKMFAIGLT